MKKLYIIKCGSTFESIKSEFYDFEDWIINKFENKNIDVSVIDAQKSAILPTLTKTDAVILTGSHSMVTDEETWSLELEKWLEDVVNKEIPLLAICYGHQLLAKSLGGVSGYHKAGMEIGTVEINLDENAKNDTIFSKLENSFKAHTIHSQTVLELPKGAIRLASNSHDKNHSFKVGSCAWGVQFHPEFDKNVMSLYIKEVSKKKDINSEKLLNQVDDTYIATSILKEFEKLFL
ncbi:glutamine amidotransferase [Arcobacter lacus]|uniref:GMP synthase n=1 Tax=Arcobacter lacus TaxID=1912876 RepID=A0ABX5JGK2_9BACT|nr:glutamine amidotransferase [Arcobacter lacus]MCT7909186.1 glutamine amidotransferase [Arcobacter lacus]PUE66257.1 GMP synthase [Arcobacter lacus]